jgi:OOP family OmpA-OmpF porin
MNRSYPHRMWLAGLFSLVATTTALATPSYWMDSNGNVVRDGSGNCVHAIHGPDFPECRGETPMPKPAPAPMPVSDSDGDGIPDARDRCPGTPQGAAVDNRGCVLVSDSDGDGIPDNRDLCANTPRGARVNASGCVDKLVVQNLVFASNTAELQPQSKTQLSSVVEKIKGNPAIRGMTITGHTDDRGAAAYNQYLSEQRAQAVRNYFIEQGIDGGMIRAVGKGESEPVADNATAAGRAQNRRVEIDFQMQ